MMKRSIKLTRKIIGASAALSCLLISWLAMSQEARQSSKTAGVQNALIKTVHFSEPNVSRVKNRFIMGSSQAVFGQIEAGKLVYSAIDLSQFNNRSHSQNITSGYSTQIVLHDLANISTEGHLATTYQATTTQSDANISPGFVDKPSLSSTGRYLSLRYEFDEGWHFPIIYDLERKGLYEIIKPGISDAASWSPDDSHFASFDVMYGEGRYPVGGLDTPDVSRRVSVQDWRTDKRVLAAQAQGIVEPPAWLNERTLIYGSLPQERKRRYDLFDVTGRLPRPNIYTYSLDKQKTQLLIKDGYRPYPSPDGKMIAFFGSPDVTQPKRLKTEQGEPSWLWRYISNGASLCVAKADGSGRIAFQPYSGLYPRIQWLPDNRRFVTIGRTKPGPNFEAEITLWNIDTQAFRKLATLHASSTETPNNTNPYDVIDFPFYPMGSSADGKQVFINCVSKQKTDIIYGSISGPTINVLQSIEIETGKISTVATVTGASGFDWKPAGSFVP